MQPPATQSLQSSTSSTLPGTWLVLEMPIEIKIWITECSGSNIRKFEIVQVNM